MKFEFKRLPNYEVAVFLNGFRSTHANLPKTVTILQLRQILRQTTERLADALGCGVTLAERVRGTIEEFLEAESQRVIADPSGYAILARQREQAVQELKDCFERERALYAHVRSLRAEMLRQQIDRGDIGPEKSDHLPVVRGWIEETRHIEAARQQKPFWWDAATKEEPSHMEADHGDQKVDGV